jgi:hypothetical protein
MRKTLDQLPGSEIHKIPNLNWQRVSGAESLKYELKLTDTSLPAELRRTNAQLTVSMEMGPAQAKLSWDYSAQMTTSQVAEFQKSAEPTIETTVTQAFNRLTAYTVHQAINTQVIEQKILGKLCENLDQKVFQKQFQLQSFVRVQGVH